MRMRTQRRKTGSTVMSEFAAGTCILVCFLLIPIFNIAFLPVRFMISNGVLAELTHRLSHCDTRTESYKVMAGDTWWKNTLAKCGVTTSGEQLTLLISSSDGSRSVALKQGDVVPSDWLPGGKNAPCIYSLETKMNCSADPLFKTTSIDVAGLTKPVTLSMTGRSQWENLSRDPRTLAYYINE